MQGADQLVEGVVAADVLATQAQLAMPVEIQRGMQGAAMARQSLGLLDTLAQGAEMGGGRQRLRRPFRQLRQGLLQGFDAAQAAAGSAGQLPALALEVPERAAADFDLGVEGFALAADADFIDVVDGLHEAAAEAETADEILDVLGRGHHHRLVQSVVADRHGTLGGKGGLADLLRQVQVGVAVIVGNGGRRPGIRGYRACRLARHGLGPIVLGVAPA